MQKAHAYGREDKIYLYGSSRTTTGLWLLSEPVLSVPRQDVVKLSQAIRDTLENSKQNIPHPKTWDKDLFKPVLQLAGVKTWNAFARSAKNVRIEHDRGEVRFVPMRSDGVDEGFVQIDGKERVVPADSPELGKALLESLSDAEFPLSRPKK